MGEGSQGQRASSRLNVLALGPPNPSPFLFVVAIGEGDGDGKCGDGVGVGGYVNTCWCWCSRLCLLVLMCLVEKIVEKYNTSTRSREDCHENNNCSIQFPKLPAHWTCLLSIYLFIYPLSIFRCLLSHCGEKNLLIG